MTVFELFELLVAYENRLDVQWGVFITVHLALFGGIIYVDRPLRPIEKVLAMIIYSGFAAINYLVSQDLALQVHAAQIEIAKFAEHACCEENELIAKVGKDVLGSSLSYTAGVLVASHAVMFVLVVLSVLLDKSRGS